MLRYALIGRCIGYSLSPELHNHAFRASGTDAVYELRDVQDLSGFDSMMAELDGANVTIPYKQEVMRLIDSATDDALAIGAVNTLYRRDGILMGANTDWRGFLTAYRMLLRDRVIVLGTGGASRAVVYALRSIGIAPDTVTHSRMDAAPIDVSGYKVVVNATPADVRVEGITNGMTVIDLRYTPSVTRFMQDAMRQGAEVHNGMKMLEAQAVESRKIWMQTIIKQ